MFCSNCGHKIEGETKFCGECGSPLTGRTEVRRGMSKAKVAAIIGACIVAIIAIVIVAAPSQRMPTLGPGLVAPVGSPAANERQVKELVIRFVQAWNNEDWQALYEMHSPDYRETWSYPVFRQGMGVSKEWAVALDGTHRMVLYEDSIKIEIEGEWAFVTYRVRQGDEEVDHGWLGVEVCQKVGGRWYATGN